MALLLAAAIGVNIVVAYDPTWPANLAISSALGLLAALADR